jgi:MFS family permease
MRKNFWAFNASNFLNGLLSASVPVSLAYAGDVNETKREKDAEIGLLVGISMLGTTGGGVIAILMQTQRLFVPLLIGAALAAVAALFNTFMLIEPRDILASRSREREEMGLLEADDNDYEDAIKAPDVLNKKHFVTIIVGALADNIGSAGLNPLCLSPPFYGPRVGANRTYVHEMNVHERDHFSLAVVAVVDACCSVQMDQHLSCIDGHARCHCISINLQQDWPCRWLRCG